MKKFFLFLGLILSASAFSLEADVKIKAAYAAFASSRVKDIYSSGAPYVQLESSFHYKKFLQFFTGVDYLIKRGFSSEYENKTVLQIATLSLGPKITFSKWKRIEPYLGLGLSLGWIHTRDHSPYVDAATNTFSAGVVTKSGLKYSLKKGLFFDFFFDYNYQPIHSEYEPAAPNTTINVGSYKVGLGVGYDF